MNIIITEPTRQDSMNSIGCMFILDAAKNAGYDIEYKMWQFVNRTKADVVLLSLHHVSDIFYLKNYKPKPGTITIAGGHVMNNPYPYLHFVDVICVGEGEEWIVNQLNLIKECDNKNKYIKKATNNSGTLTKYNINEYIDKIYIDDISINNKQLNVSRKKGHLDTWYVEIARGCRSKCNYCELGWTNAYRENSREKVFSELDKITNHKTQRVNIFAPDDFSCSFYNETMHKIFDLGLQTKFGSMRVDRFDSMRKIHKKNFLFRLGVDGLSERIRGIVNKKISNKKIIELFKQLIDSGFVRFKMFFVFSYQFETMEDFKEFVWLMEQLKYHAKKLSRPVSLRLKFTPFIPQPLTPMERFYPQYNYLIREKIEMFFLKENLKRTNIIFENDGIMSEHIHLQQCFFNKAKIEDFTPDELVKDWFLPKSLMDIAKKQNTKHIKINTKFSSNQRDRVFNNIISKCDAELNYYNGALP